MYANLREVIFNAMNITGTFVPQYIYLGVLVFIIASFATVDRWKQFFGVLVCGLVLITLDILFAGLTLASSAYHLLHFILIPFLVTSIIRRG